MQASKPSFRDILGYKRLFGVKIMHVETVNKRKSADIPVDIIAHRLNTCTAVDNTVFIKNLMHPCRAKV